jgi:uncharacterized protein YbjT (DUF2867 family)
MARVAIIGGHGQVALRLSRLLTERGHQVTSLFRNPEQTDDVRDVEESSADEIARRMGGHDALVWSAGAGGGNPARTYAVDRDAAIRSMDAAGQAGVGRYIMVSYLGAGLQHGVPEDDPFFAYAEAKAAADDYLRKTELDWTILGPGRLTLEEPSGRIAVGPDVEKAGRNTSRGNVALVAVAVMGEPQTIGMTIAFVDGEMPIEKAILKGVGE